MSKRARRLRIAGIVLLVLGQGAAFGGCQMFSMPGRSFQGALPPLSAEQTRLRDTLREHIRVLSAEIGDRNVIAYEGLNRSADYIVAQLKAAGFEPTFQSYRVGGKAVRNIEVTIAGNVKKDEIVVVGAHYDSVHDCPAANDNASGVAGAIELARSLAKGKQPSRTIRVVFFVNEEPPYFQTEQMGSLVYARACRERGDHIVAMFSLETIGYFSDTPGSQQYPAPLGALYPDRGDFIAFVGNFSSRQLVRDAIGSFRRHAQFPSEGGALPEALPGIGWSDHWSFSQVGYQAIMITDTAPFRYPHYHTAQDTIDKLDFDRMSRVVDGMQKVVEEFANW